jgi:predicted RNase H-like HicB family nuclease
MREYRVRFQQIEDGWIMATVPELPGAITQGRDMDEAREMIRDAIRELLAYYRERDQAPNAVYESVMVEA